MEILSMGPKRGRSLRPSATDPVTIEPLELSAESARGESPVAGNGSASPAFLSQGGFEEAAIDEHWLYGMLRAEVLAISAIAMLVITVVGLPVTDFMTTLSVYGPTSGGSTSWMFAPMVVGAGMAAALGIAALRQAARQVARQPASRWIQVSAGVGAMVGSVLCLGIALMWWYTANSELLDRFPS